MFSVIPKTNQFVSSVGTLLSLSTPRTERADGGLSPHGDYAPIDLAAEHASALGHVLTRVRELAGTAEFPWCNRFLADSGKDKAFHVWLSPEEQSMFVRFSPAGGTTSHPHQTLSIHASAAEKQLSYGWKSWAALGCGVHHSPLTVVVGDPMRLALRATNSIDTRRGRIEFNEWPQENRVRVHMQELPIGQERDVALPTKIKWADPRGRPRPLEDIALEFPDRAEPISSDKLDGPAFDQLRGFLAEMVQFPVPENASKADILRGKLAGRIAQAIIGAPGDLNKLPLLKLAAGH